MRIGYKTHKNGTDKIENQDKENLKQIEENFHKAINDDMNMTLAVSYVWEAIKYPKKLKEVSELLEKMDTVLGIEINKEINSNKQENMEQEIPEEIKELIEQRQKAREEKNWQESDRIRDLIKEKGYLVKDTKEGMKIEKG